MNECHKITHKGELRLVAPVTAPIGGASAKRGENGTRNDHSGTDRNVHGAILSFFCHRSERLAKVSPSSAD
jgi:hypothetical protein